VSIDSVSESPNSPERPGAAVDPAAPFAALELMAAVLAHADEDTAPDALFSALAEAVCRLTSMTRAVLFLYDEVLREVRVAGIHGVDAALFQAGQVSLESAPIAARALSEDRVIEVRTDAGEALAPEYAPLVLDRALVCTPMAAAGRHIGVILADREPDAPPLEDGERDLLWVFGKLAALAAMAGTATRKSERARLLEHRLELARDLHERVVQRLFGVSLALSADAELDRDGRTRCADELTEAAADLRFLVQRPDGSPRRQAQRSLGGEIDRLRREHPELGIEAGDLAAGSPPEGLESVVQSVLAEAIRNAHKHAAPTRVEVRTRLEEGAFVLEVENDGVGMRPATNGSTVVGLGLRLAAFDALEFGGFVEFGPKEPGTWQVKLVLPGGAP
jgi:signal transduction histidine kinase